MNDILVFDIVSSVSELCLGLENGLCVSQPRFTLSHSSSLAFTEMGEKPKALPVIQWIKTGEAERKRSDKDLKTDELFKMLVNVEDKGIATSALYKGTARWHLLFG